MNLPEIVGFWRFYLEFLINFCLKKLPDFRVLGEKFLSFEVFEFEFLSECPKIKPEVLYIVSRQLCRAYIYTY